MESELKLRLEKIEKNRQDIDIIKIIADDNRDRLNNLNQTVNL